MNQDTLNRVMIRKRQEWLQRAVCLGIIDVDQRDALMALFLDETAIAMNRDAEYIVIKGTRRGR